MGALCGQLPQSFILILLKLTDVLMMLRRYACALDIILGLIFDTFLQFELSCFSGILTMKVNGQWVLCVCNSSPSFIPILLKLYRCLDNASEICMCFGYNPQINF